MVLLDDVVEVFHLAHQDRHVAAGVDRIHGALLAPLLSIATLFGSPFAPMALSKKRMPQPCRATPSAGSQRSCRACRRRSRGIFPDALDLDVGLTHAPVAADRGLYYRAIFSMGGRKRLAHRLIDEWLIDTPRCSMISSRCP
jgi:hypothetical protein